MSAKLSPINCLQPYLLEVVAELDDGTRAEQPVLAHHKLTVLERVNVALDEEQVGTTLNGQETATRNVDTMGVVEVLDGSTGGSLELQQNETLDFGNHPFRKQHT